MNKINYLLLVLVMVCASCSTADETVPQDTQGTNMLLIGNSFFRPYAEQLNALADEAGYTNHSSTLVFAGGENGRPINLWEVSDSRHSEIKDALDRGDVSIFGMTAGLLPENLTDGFSDWIAYALQNNPDITIFLSTPPPDFPNQWEQTAADLGFETIAEAYDYFVNETVNNTLIDALRAEFPGTTIFSIPTGRASLVLREMHENELLLDDIVFMGPYQNALFTDDKGHQGKLIITTGALMWLNGIYNEDLETNDFDTGFQTDVHAIAKTEMANHDPNYKR
jgi:hypothetical protein